MSATVAIARHQLQTLARGRTFLLMLAVLLVMTALSGFIGWSTHSTITRVYEETVRTFTASGKPIPANPFAATPRLSLLNNMIIYVPLIGALLAVVIGHISMMADRQAGVARAIFSRPVTRSSYFWGKLSGAAVAVLAIMAACLVLSLVAVGLINGGVPTGAEILRMALFYAVSGLYLMIFVLVGAIAALLTKSQSMALLLGVAVWVLVTFATPQFTSGLRPVASLNPVTAPVATTNSAFFRATSKARPIAVSEQYKALSARILTGGGGVQPATTARQLAPLVGFGAILAGWAFLLVRRRDFSEEAVRD